MKFTKEFLLDVLESCDPELLVDDIELHAGRWSSYREMIFKHEDHYYSAEYERGLSDSQDVTPFEDYEYSDEIECDEVEPYEVVVVRYRKLVP